MAGARSSGAVLPAPCTVPTERRAPKEFVERLMVKKKKKMTDCFVKHPSAEEEAGASRERKGRKQGGKESNLSGKPTGQRTSDIQ